MVYCWMETVVWYIKNTISNKDSITELLRVILNDLTYPYLAQVTHLPSCIAHE